MRLRSDFALFGFCLAVACSGATSVADSPAGPTARAAGATRAADSTVPDNAQQAGAQGRSPDRTPYPETRREDVVDTLHGVAVADPYRWLEDISDPRVNSWLEAQNRHARAALDRLAQRGKLAERFKQLLYLDFVSPPYHRSGRFFYSKRHKDKEKRIVYWKQGENGKERVLLDPNTWSKDGSVSLRGYFLSWDGKTVAYKKSQNNADESVLYVRDIDSGADSPIDVIEGVKYGAPSWTPDNRGFYYEWLPSDPAISAAERPGYTEVRYHKLGSDPKQDRVIFPATRDPSTFLGGVVSRDGRWLTLYIQRGWNRTDLYVKRLDGKSSRDQKRRAPAAKSATELAQMTTEERVAHHAAERGFVPFVVGEEAIFRPYWWKGWFYVYTNYQAPRYRIFKVAPDAIGNIARWREIVAEGPAKLDGMQVIGEHLVLPYLRNAASEVEIRDFDGKLVRKVELPEIGSSRGMLGNPDEDTAYFGFTSFTTPTQIYQTSIKSGKTQLWYQLELPVDVSQIASRQVWYRSKDGTRVSMFLIHRTDSRRDGKTPTLLYGYGGFSISLTPSFSSTAAVWLEQGGMYAIANLRGGGEYGEEWHKSGMLDKKQNVFDDYIAAAEYLIREGYTNPEKLAIYGGSNGGLLVGAAMTQRPELFRAVVCSVPLLDMVRYHKFGSGKTWIPEYGTADKAEQFKFLHAYSPYHRVAKNTEYPSLLMLTADSDDRVDPMHARKFVAAIQWASARHDRPVLMRVERKAGHGGADLVKKRVERSADLVAYLMWQLGM
ncbi:MAG: prolyl oligopeptidase family serine peptidase [Proteobacteria bacterium]|nr:prolyl oligopeptidase family serine peptidase [Pseudomonadota bacterium]